jgi:hypothetical protein
MLPQQTTVSASCSGKGKSDHKIHSSNFIPCEKKNQHDDENYISRQYLHVFVNRHSAWIGN